MNVIETHGLTKRYRRKLAVDNLDMTVATGDIYGFVGKNGSGKSTTMKMICGLARPTAGEVVLFGDPENGGATPQGFSRIGALIESPGVLASLTARDNLVAKALALGLTHAGQVADDLLGLVGLDPMDHRRVKAYSLGMTHAGQVADDLLSDAQKPRPAANQRTTPLFPRFPTDKNVNS